MKTRVDQKWICVSMYGGKVGLADYTTLKWTRKESIASLIGSEYSWNHLRSFGWRCIKVNISFEISER